MKNYRVHVTRAAANDMTEIARYIAGELMQPETAGRFLDKLEEKFYSLETSPFIYPLIPEKYFSTFKIRKLPVENYIIFYSVSEESKKVYIVRVLYQKRNWTDLI